MPIAVFDIDGTLTDTVDVDLECYGAAILELTGIEIPDDWPELDEVTDSAILATACARAGRPAPSSDEGRRIADRVGSLLRAELASRPDRFRPIAGAREVFDAVRDLGWRVAIATGAWRPSALVKLEGAQIPFREVALATCSEQGARADIIRRALGEVGRDGPTPGDGGADEQRDAKRVYVGDGVWDGRAATSIGCTFVGVGRGSRREALRRAGAALVVPDLTRLAPLLDGL